MLCADKSRDEHNIRLLFSVPNTGYAVSGYGGENQTVSLYKSPAGRAFSARILLYKVIQGDCIV